MCINAVVREKTSNFVSNNEVSEEWNNNTETKHSMCEKGEECPQWGRQQTFLQLKNAVINAIR